MQFGIECLDISRDPRPAPVEVLYINRRLFMSSATRPAVADPPGNSVLDWKFAVLQRFGALMGYAAVTSGVLLPPQKVQLAYRGDHRRFPATPAWW